LYVHPTSGLCFLANPRTGSTALAAALQARGFVKVGTHHSATESDWISASIPHFRRLTTFCLVRNLRDAIASWGRKFTAEDDWVPGFPLVLSEILDRLDEEAGAGEIEDWPSWTLFPHTANADYIFRYEEMPRPLIRLLARYEIEPITEWKTT
jgi:hypothetical protein